VIHASALTKVFRVPVKDPGLVGSVRSLFRRQTREVAAVTDVHLDVAEGERVGFLGPNGAGKTTTLKMLTGLLVPTSGRATVAGFVPSERRAPFLRAITLVMGSKQQLLWDLPPIDTFVLHRALYDIPRSAWEAAVDELVGLLGLAEVVRQPTRTLSLGQRMRCELVASLLHGPKVLFLDEPTIGLDVEVQIVVRDFLRTWCARHAATLVLTSHDMRDVEALVERLVLIDRGRIRFDGSLDAFRARFGEGRRLVVRRAPALDGLPFLPDGHDAWAATVPRSDVNGLLAEVLRRAPDADVTVGDPPLEAVLAAAFGAADP
jgi:ABC-2 type transport system ATP-binding protein